MRYPGGKNGSGVYQRLISMMPPHDVYIELFLGSGAVMRRKKLANQISIAYELNQATIRDFSAAFIADRGFVFNRHSDDAVVIYDAAGDIVLEIPPGDALAAIKNRFSASSAFWLQNDPGRTLIYADPPYLLESRRSKNAIYQNEMFSRAEHTELLDLLAAVPCKVMVSGYANPLYNRKLKAWRREDFSAVDRAGNRRTESVWLNFPEPFELHDYEHVGEDYRDRWRIEKRARRWVSNFLKMPPAERYAIFGRLEDARAEHSKAEREAQAAAQANRQAIAKRRHRENTKPSVTPNTASAAAEPAGLFD